MACSHFVGQENISPPRKKKHDSPILIKKKWQLTSARKDDRSGSKKEASSDDADRTFPNRHHANFVRGSNWRLNSRQRSWKAPTDIFQPTLHNIFYKCRPIMYLHGRVSFVVRCLLQNLQCRLVWFFSCEFNRRCVSVDNGMFAFCRPRKH